MLTTNDDQAADAGTFFARSLTSQAHFELEQERLAGVWTFVGLMNDLEGDGAWFRATLGGRSIFVQRFGNTLRGFPDILELRLGNVSAFEQHQYGRQLIKTCAKTNQS
jgi:hypothetical protein